MGEGWGENEGRGDLAGVLEKGTPRAWGTGGWGRVMETLKCQAREFGPNATGKAVWCHSKAASNLFRRCGKKMEFGVRQTQNQILALPLVA